MITSDGGFHVFKTTILGGLVFLVPVVIAIVIFAKAAGLMMMVAEPMAGWLPVDSIGGVALANVIAFAAVVLVCFLAGLAARAVILRTAVEGLESRMLSKIPGYVIVRGMLSGLRDGDSQHLFPVVATVGEVSQIGLEIERLDDGRVVVLIPTPPNPWSGKVSVMDADAVQRLALPLASYKENIERFGQGTRELLRAATDPPTINRGESR